MPNGDEIRESGGHLNPSAPNAVHRSLGSTSTTCGGIFNEHQALCAVAQLDLYLVRQLTMQESKTPGIIRQIRCAVRDRMQKTLSAGDFHGRWLQMKKLISVLSLLMLTAGASFANEPGSEKPHPWLDARLKERRYRCPVGASPFRGPADAPVTITEFIDYECPYCGQEEETLKKVLKAYPTQVKLVVKNLPLEKLHPDAKRKAVVIDCIGLQGKFWQAHDKVLAGEPLKKVRNCVDQSKLNADIAQGGDGQVQKDLNLAQKMLGMASTPSFVVDGIRIGSMLNFKQFKLLVDAELDRKANLAKAKAAAAEPQETAEPAPPDSKPAQAGPETE